MRCNAILIRAGDIFPLMLDSSTGTPHAQRRVEVLAPAAGLCSLLSHVPYWINRIQPFLGAEYGHEDACLVFRVACAQLLFDALCAHLGGRKNFILIRFTINQGTLTFGKFYTYYSGRGKVGGAAGSCDPNGLMAHLRGLVKWCCIQGSSISTVVANDMCGVSIIAEMSGLRDAMVTPSEGFRLCPAMSYRTLPLHANGDSWS